MADHEPSDVEVIRRSLGDPEAFTLVFERHFGSVHGYLLRRLDRSTADELASEVLVRAFCDRGRFDPVRGEVRVWLFGIAHNLLRGHRRSEVRQLRAYARAVAAEGSGWDREDDVDARVDAGRLSGALAEALAALPRAQRDVLLLHAWAELDHAEVAEALGISAGTVRSRLSRARSAIRERISAIGEDVYR